MPRTYEIAAVFTIAGEDDQDALDRFSELMFKLIDSGESLTWRSFGAVESPSEEQGIVP